MQASSQVVFYDQVSCSYKQLLFFFICLVFLYLSQFCFQNAVLDLSDFQHIFFKCSYINNPPIPLVFFFFWSSATLDWFCLGLVHGHLLQGVLGFLSCLFPYIHCHLHFWFTPQFCWSTFFSSLLRKNIWKVHV